MDTAKHVLLRIEANTSVEGHDLHQSPGTGIAGNTWLAATFNQHDSRYQAWVEDVLVGVLGYERAPSLDGLGPGSV